jgi:hypothetical protein
MNQKMKSLKPVDYALYQSIDLDRLVMYAVAEIDKVGLDLSLENIIVGAFILFPKKFSLIGYAEFPDATRVEKCLWRCKGKNRQWISGKTPHGYVITDRTRSIASEVGTLLRAPSSITKNTPTRMRRKEAILKEVANSPAYNKYMNGTKESISEADFCYLLQGTLDSSREILRENLVALKQITKELERQDVLNFLNWLEGHFSTFLEEK